MRHARSYIKKIGGLKVIPTLLRSPASKKVPSYTRDSILVEKLEEWVDLSIQEIVHPLDQLDPESPVVSIFSQSLAQYPPRIMDDVNQPTWRERTPLNLVAALA